MLIYNCSNISKYFYNTAVNTFWEKHKPIFIMSIKVPLSTSEEAARCAD